MKLLTTFVLVGVIDTKDDFFATVDISLNPQTEHSGQAIMPLSAFPCQIKEGDTFYILKLTKETLPVILCKQDMESLNQNDGDK